VLSHLLSAAASVGQSLCASCWMVKVHRSCAGITNRGAWMRSKRTQMVNGLGASSGRGLMGLGRYDCGNGSEADNQQ